MNGRIHREGAPAGLALSIIGNISIGMKAEGKGYPTSVDYFIPRGKYAALFTREYGDKPSTIQVLFISDDAKQVCSEEYEYRTDDGRLWASGDGLEFKVWSAAKKEYQIFNIVEHPELMEGIHTKVNAKKGWQVTLTMRCLLPKIRNVVGLWQFRTKGSKSTIPNIVGTFDTVLKHRGSVSGVLFDLNVAFAKSQKPGDTSRFPVVTLVPNNENTIELKNNLLLNQNNAED